MKWSEKITSITTLKTRPAHLVKQVSRNHRPVIITQNGLAKVVIQDMASYERDKKALLLLKLLSFGVADAEKGKLIPQKTAFKQLAQKIKKISKND